MALLQSTLTYGGSLITGDCPFSILPAAAVIKPSENLRANLRPLHSITPVSHREPPPPVMMTRTFLGYSDDFVTIFTPSPANLCVMNLITAGNVDYESYPGRAPHRVYNCDFYFYNLREILKCEFGSFIVTLLF